MSERDRDAQGRFEEKIKLSDVLEMFDDEPLTATEIANRLDISNRAALNKLNDLHDEGMINRKEVGAKAIIWWRTD